MADENNTEQRYILTLSSPDRKGIVRAVANFLYDWDANIIDAGQHGDPVSKRFFLRTEFCGASAQSTLGLPAAAIQLFQGMLLFFLLAVDLLTNYRIRLRTTEAA